jgi:hypothetical protein
VREAGEFCVLTLSEWPVWPYAVANPQLIERATVAIVVGGLDQNALEALTVMPLIENSASLVGADLAGMFESVAAVVGHPGSISLGMWLGRAPEDRTLESMGFVESKDQDGFRYKRTW